MGKDIVAILDVAEPANFKRRNHVGVMEKGAPRFFRANAGKAPDGEKDRGVWFDEDGLKLLGALARGQSLHAFTDKELAMARWLVIFPINHYRR